MGIRINDELDVAAGSGAEQETRFSAHGKRVDRQRQVEGGLEVVIVLELVGGGATVRELPDIPVGIASGLADARLFQPDGIRIAVGGPERGPGDVVENTRRYNGRVDGGYLSISPGNGSEANDRC